MGRIALTEDNQPFLQFDNKRVMFFVNIVVNGDGDGTTDWINTTGGLAQFWVNTDGLYP